MVGDDMIGWMEAARGCKVKVRQTRVGGEEEGEDTLHLPLIDNLAESVVHGVITNLPAC
jgi:hypothetical protein